MAPSIIDLMKPEIRVMEGGESELRFNVRPEFTIPSGVVQGGIVAVMLDMAMAIAGEGGFSTASLYDEIMRPVKDEELTARGRVVRRGRRIVFVEAELCDDAGVVLARGTQTAVPID